MIIGFVKGQSFKASQPVVVAGAINYLDARVVFQTADWRDLVKILHFKGSDGVDHPFILNGDTLPEDAGLNLPAGKWTVFVSGHGVDMTQRITTNSAEVTVMQYDGDSGLGDIAPDIAEQILTKAERAERTAQSVRDDADAGNFNGADGGYYTVKATASGDKLTLTFTPSAPGMAEIPPQTVTLDIPGADPTDIAKAVEEYLTAHPVQAPVTSVNSKTGDVTLTAKDVQAVGLDQLPQAINTALAEAKASGAFKGDPGRDGAPGRDGKDGAPGKDGQDGAQGKDGPPGSAGKDGGYYTPDVQESAPGTVEFSFSGSKPEMAPAGPFTVQIPSGGASSADKVTATVPSGITAESNVQSVLNALAARPGGALKPLTFTGASTGEYDGSKPLTINIPAGGVGEKPWKLHDTVTITTTTDYVQFDLPDVDEVMCIFDNVQGAKVVGMQSAINIAPYTTADKIGGSVFDTGFPTNGFVHYIHIEDMYLMGGSSANSSGNYGGDPLYGYRRARTVEEITTATKISRLFVSQAGFGRNKLTAGKFRCYIRE